MELNTGLLKIVGQILGVTRDILKLREVKVRMTKEYVVSLWTLLSQSFRKK